MSPSHDDRGDEEKGDSLLKVHWNTDLVEKYDVAKEDLFRAAKSELEKKYDALRSRQLAPENAEEFDAWIVAAYTEFFHDASDSETVTHQTIPRQSKFFIRLFLLAGVLELLLLDDWSVNRTDQQVSNNHLGITSFIPLQDLIASRVEGELIHLHLGPGDCELMSSLQSAGSPWGHLGIGDKVYFSMERILIPFLIDSTDPDKKEFVRILSLFVAREFKRAKKEPLMAEDAIVDLNRMRAILQTPSVWLKKDYDPATGKHTASKEFEFDSESVLSGRVRSWFDQLATTADEDLLSFYQHFFQESFVSEIFGLLHSMDFNDLPAVPLQGFICDTFDNIHRTVETHSISLISAVRSTSHMGWWGYFKLFSYSLSLMKPGAVLVEDGFKRSYNRDLRLDPIRALMDLMDKEFRAWVVVNKSTDMPMSVFVERGIKNGSNYEFYSDDMIGNLSEVFDFSKVELAPLDRVARRTDLVFETVYRRDLFGELTEGVAKVLRVENDQIRVQILETMAAYDVPIFIEDEHPLQSPIVLDLMDAIRGKAPTRVLKPCGQ